MKLNVPPLELAEYEGFAPEKDIFQRKLFAEQLTNLIISTSDELVIVLDAPWGEGKTTFVKMWRGLLRGQGVESIYFDAFKNDFIEDPFLAITGELYSLSDKIKSKTLKNKFNKKAISALKTFGKAGLHIGIKAASAGLLDETILEGLKIEQDIVEISDKYIIERLETLESDKKSIEDFKVVLQEIAEKIGNSQKVIFIIDELDRCKPSFSLDLVEKIKHVFSVPGITFILAMNREQMEQIIKSRYGLGIIASKYLQKFVHLWTALPKSSDQYSSNGKKYLEYCLEKMDHTKTKNQELAIKYYEELIDHYEMSLREIERSLTNFAVIFNAKEMADKSIKISYLLLTVYLCIAKVLFPATYKKIKNEKISYPELVSETDMATLKEEGWIENNYLEEHPLRYFLMYCLASDEEAKQLRTQKQPSEPPGKDFVNNICNLLETFKQ